VVKIRGNPSTLQTRRLDRSPEQPFPIAMPTPQPPRHRPRERHLEQNQDERAGAIDVGASG
jgi:hypothetical protein